MSHCPLEVERASTRTRLMCEGRSRTHSPAVEYKVPGYKCASLRASLLDFIEFPITIIFETPENNRAKK